MKAVQAEIEKDYLANAEKMKRIKWIDIAKGICMLSVILGHLSLNEVNVVVFSFHLTVFFILSGFTMRIEVFNKELIQKKFVAYMKPYFVTCLFVLVGDVVNCILLEGTASTEIISKIIGNDLVRSFFASGDISVFGGVQLPGRIGAIWFFPALFWGGILVYGILYYISSDFMRWFAILLCASLAVISREFLWLPFSIQSGVLAAIFIMFGYYLKKAEILNKLTFKLALICLLIWVLGIKYNYSMLVFVTNYMKDYFVTSIVGLASSLFIFWVSRKLNACTPLEFVGRNSMYYLCVHLFELEVVSRWYNLYLLPNFKDYYEYALVLFSLKIVFISVIVILILQSKKYLERKKNHLQGKTIDNNLVILDVSKALIIGLIIASYFLPSSTLKNIVNSCSITSYIIISGFSYSAKGMVNKILDSCKRFLMPAVVIFIGNIIFSVQTVSQLNLYMKQFLLGISNSSSIFLETKGIGVVYLLVLLFGVEIFYIVLDSLFNDKKFHIVIGAVSIIGFFMGQYGKWLPFGIDIMMYACVFYHIGHLLSKYKVLEKKVISVYYFFFSPIVAYLTYVGGLDILNRMYRDYFIGIAGAVAGFSLLYFLSDYLKSSKIYKINEKVVKISGESLSYILIGYGIFFDKISKLLQRIFDIKGIYYVVSMCLFFVILGMVIKMSGKYLKKQLGRLRG